MKVSVEHEGERAVVLLEGRLDGEWAEHLSDALAELLRAGTRAVIVDMSRVQYASSAATAVLARRGQDFAAVRAELLLASPPPAVYDVLNVAGLGDRILRSPHGTEGRPRISAELELRSPLTREWRAPQTPPTRGQYEVSPYEPGASLACRLYGAPERLARAGVSADDCHPVAFGDDVFGIGIGAIGDSFEDCRYRMGELLGAAGAVAYLPTDGAHVADYLLGARDYTPRALIGSGVVCEGAFAQLARFTTRVEAGPAPLAELADVLLRATGSDAAGMVVVAETARLVGAWLLRSPAVPSEVPSFEVPSVRSWFSLTAEPSHPATTSLVVGVAARKPGEPLASHLRPLGGTTGLHGHFHAVVFSYAPVPQRTMAMPTVVRSLFEHERIRALLHLLCDDRKGTGAGHSTFLRGLAWAAPIARISREGEA